MGGDSAQKLQTAAAGITHHRRRLIFPTGTTVEVHSNEKDFKGAGFSATVITPPNSPRKSGRKKSNKLYVEYHDLLAREDSSDRLREYVDESLVRPPPPLLDTSEGFEVDDVVDAFYKDGWWTGGVVNRRLDGKERYVVTFRNPYDKLELGISVLRAHWDWLNGWWVLPLRAEFMFDMGREVEVSFDSRDAWFPFTIREDLGNGTYLVAGKTHSDDELCEVSVDSLHIRPCPPLLKDKKFCVLEEVDVFFDLGWWRGTIGKQLENSRYLVSINQMKCNKEFTESQLRVHMDWEDGKWFVWSQPHGSLQNTASVKNNSSDETSDPLLVSRDGHSKPLVLDDPKSVHVTPPLRKKRSYVSESEQTAMADTTLDHQSYSNHFWEEHVQRKQRSSRERRNKKIVISVDDEKQVNDSTSQKETEKKKRKLVESIEMHRPSAADDSNSQCIINDDNESNNVVLGEEQPETLPFVKTNLFWESIESEDVFKKMPQKPHFKSLANMTESSREGRALGLMVTFSGLVKNTSKLQIDDPTSTMLDMKETLAELEENRFEVKVVDDCLCQLLTVKNTREKLVHDVTSIDDQITVHNQEKTRIDKEIDEINEQIMVLQEKLKLAESAKESKDEDAAFLLVRQREIKDNMKKGESDFSKIASSIS